MKHMQSPAVPQPILVKLNVINDQYENFYRSTTSQEGLYSAFAAANEPNNDSFQIQIKIDKEYNVIMPGYIRPIVKSIKIFCVNNSSKFCTLTRAVNNVILFDGQPLQSSLNGMTWWGNEAYLDIIECETTNPVIEMLTSKYTKDDLYCYVEFDLGLPGEV